jgi:integrase
VIEKKQTSDGRARYEVRLRGADGKERSRTFRTRKEAERFHRVQLTAIDQGVWIDPRSGRVTLRLWSAEWQRTVVHLRGTTQRIYDANLRNHILPMLGDIEIAKLTPSLLRAWLAELTIKPNGKGDHLALASVSQAYRTLNRVLGAAVDNELLGRNPLRSVKPPRVETQAMRFLTHDDVATLAFVIDRRYRALVLVAAYCGLRAGELTALRRKHVDLLHKSITVVEQVQWVKGGHETSEPKTAAGRRRSRYRVSSPTRSSCTSEHSPNPASTASCSPRHKAASCSCTTSASACGRRLQRPRAWLRYASTTCATPARRSPSPRART